MKSFLEFFPIAVFVGVYFYSSAEQPMYPAVQALMIASVIQTIGSRLLTGKFAKVHLWTLLITLVFGSFTLAFRDPAFIQWKASIIVWLAAAVFFYTQLISKKPLIQKMLQSTLEDIVVPEKVWFSINLVWPIAHLLFGFLNLYIAFNYSEAFWVKFKLFGLLGLTFSLIIYSFYKIFPYFPEETADKVDKLNSVEINSNKEE